MLARSLLTISTALAATASTASAQFVETDVTVLRLFEGEQVGDLFGWVGANLGDLDGDGANELAIPAIGHNGVSGRVTVYSGSSGEVLNDVFGAPASPPTVLGYSVSTAGDVDADGTADYIMGGRQVLIYSGATHELIDDLSGLVGFAHSVAGAGDLDGDGYGDVLVGSQSGGANQTFEGRLYAVSGADSSVLWFVDGELAGDQLGSAAGGLGDINGDGTPDVVVGAFGAGPGGGGEAYALSGADGARIHRFEPFDTTTASVFGQFFASGAGDVDGDGVGDVFVADYNSETGTGRAYVFSGSDAFPIHLLAGFDPGDGFGPGRAIADVNGDGHPDVFVGAFTDSSGTPGAGAAYLFSGRSGALLRTFTATLDGDQFGVDALGTGDVDGDGLPDYLVTAVGLSFAGIDTGRAYLIGGTVLPCPADLTGNERVNIFDALLMAAAIHSPDLEADINGDGDTDLGDFGVLLRDWGRCARGRPR